MRIRAAAFLRIDSNAFRDSCYNRFLLRFRVENLRRESQLEMLLKSMLSKDLGGYNERLTVRPIEVRTVRFSTLLDSEVDGLYLHVASTSGFSRSCSVDFVAA